MILVPVKNLATAKQRLASVLDQPVRTELAKVMLHDVLATLAQWNESKVALVTSDPFAVQLAEQYGFEVIRDPDNAGETAAIEMATRRCVEIGVESTLVMPADIPLVQCWELTEIMLRAPEQGSLLVPASDGRGTNAALRRPANLFPLRFGNDSFRPHVTAAQATQKPCVVVELPGIAIDIDSPSDLQKLLKAPGETRSQRLVRGWNLSDRRPASELKRA